MNSLYDAAMQVVDELEQERLQVARLSMVLAEAKYALQLTRAKIERGLVKKVGGEKRLGPTVDDRARIFTVAVDADETYREQWKQHNKVRLQLEEAKVRVAALSDKLSVILTAMQAQKDSR